MKDFLKYTLATVTGIVVTSLVIGIFSVLVIAGMASMESETTPIADNSVMVIKLTGTLSERAKDNPFAEILGEVVEENGLDDILAAIKCAKENTNIKGIYLEGGTFAGATPAMIEELRDALVDFKTSGKFIVAYGDNYTQGTYYLCSTADSLIINPGGMVELSGLASQTMYYKNMLAKIGVKMQVFKVGTYKSAVEPFLLDDMSDANREQINVFTSEVWGQMLKDISKSRKLKTDDINALVDSALILKPAQFYIKNKIADKLAYSDAVPQIIANMMKVGVDKYKTITVKDVVNTAKNSPKSMSGDIVAVYYAYGDIVQDAETSSLMPEEQIVGSKVIKDLKDLADDNNVKAVVLRVNSPGGSAYASEQIWHQVMNIKAKKPIVVSMGGYAASGGYYISCAADWIVAEPTTLTGSIGIFGMFPEASELVKEKLGVNVVTVTTNKYSDIGNFFRPMNDGESAAMQAYINRGYELFTKRCADGRKISQDSIKVIGEGRIWTGVHAKKIGLVDQLGNLDDAIVVAKKRAKLNECTVMPYPAKAGFFEQLLEKTQSTNFADTELKENFGEYYDMFRSLKNINSKDRIQAALPFYLKFNL